MQLSAAQDLRGQHARRVCFIPASGKAVVRKLRGNADVQLVQKQEGELLRKLGGPRASPSLYRSNNATAEAMSVVKNKGSW